MAVTAAIGARPLATGEPECASAGAVRPVNVAPKVRAAALSVPVPEMLVRPVPVSSRIFSSEVPRYCRPARDWTMRK
ncbi:hypothetical protein SFUMM280S_01067 [Streptomyces fumanus]